MQEELRMSKMQGCISEESEFRVLFEDGVGNPEEVVIAVVQANSNGVAVEGGSIRFKDVQSALSAVEDLKVRLNGLDNLRKFALSLTRPGVFQDPVLKDLKRT